MVVLCRIRPVGVQESFYVYRKELLDRDVTNVREDTSIWMREIQKDVLNVTAWDTLLTANLLNTTRTRYEYFCTCLRT